VPSSQHSDRRRHTRYPIITSVIFSQGGSLDTFMPSDISAGGVFLFSETAPKIGTEVHIEVVLGRQSFRLTGVVVRDDTDNAERRGFAIQFRIEEETQHKLADSIVAEAVEGKSNP